MVGLLKPKIHNNYIILEILHMEEFVRNVPSVRNRKKNIDLTHLMGFCVIYSNDQHRAHSLRFEVLMAVTLMLTLSGEATW